MSATNDTTAAPAPGPASSRGEPLSLRVQILAACERTATATEELVHLLTVMRTQNNQILDTLEELERLQR